MFNNISLFILDFDQINVALVSIRDFFQSYRPQTSLMDTGWNVSRNCNLISIRSRSHLALNRASAASSMALALSLRASFSAFHWADFSSGGVWTQTHDNVTSSRKSVHKSWNLNAVICNIVFKHVHRQTVTGARTPALLSSMPPWPVIIGDGSVTVVFALNFGSLSMLWI